MDNEYNAKAPKGIKPSTQTTKTQIDGAGSLFVNPTIRHLRAVTINTPLPDGPCDYLIASAACTATIQAAEDDPSGPVGPVALVALVAGWNPISAVNVSAISGGATLVAGYIRRPAAV